MASKKKTRKKVNRLGGKVSETAVVMASESEVLPAMVGKLSWRGSKQWGLVVLVVLLLAVAFGLWQKGWFVAALVNGQPITRWDLNQTLTKQYGAQTLDNMVNQKIAEQEVAKEGVTVSAKEIDDRISQVSATMPQGMTLSQALQMQGMDMAQFRNQIRLQIAIDKILATKVTVSDKEVDQYIASNAAQFKGVPQAAARSTAKNSVLQQKESDEFSSWFSSLKQKATVVKFT